MTDNDWRDGRYGGILEALVREVTALGETVRRMDERQLGAMEMLAGHDQRIQALPCPDREQRMRSLERWRWYMAGAGAIVMAMASGACAIAAKVYAP